MRLIVGTRGSPLALAQARWVCAQVEAHLGGVQVSLQIVRTHGDESAAPLHRFGGQGAFTSRLEAALLAGRIDAAVHSLKDLPVRMAAGLIIAATPAREDVRDVLVAPGCGSLDALPRGARVGTGSPRRRAQLLALRPDLQVCGVRGNLETRIELVEAGRLEAVVLAAAGLHRLGLQDRIGCYLDPAQMLPAVGQAALAVQVRRDSEAAALLAVLDHAPTRAAITAERAFLAALGGGCHAPIAAWARLEDGRLLLDGMVAHPDGAPIVRGQTAGSPAQAAALGPQLAASLRFRGAGAWAEARRPDGGDDDARAEQR